MRRWISIAAAAATCAALAGALVWAFVAHWPQSSGEWASWAQAFGAVLALGVAVWLQFKSRGDARRDAKRAAKGYAVQAMITFRFLAEACAQQNLMHYQARFAVLKDLVQTAHSVPIGLLSDQNASNMMTARTHVIAAVTQANAFNGVGSWQAWENFFEGERAQAATIVDSINSHR